MREGLPSGSLAVGAPSNRGRGRDERGRDERMRGRDEREKRGWREKERERER